MANSASLDKPSGEFITFINSERLLHRDEVVMSIDRVVTLACVLAAGVAGFLLGDYRGQIEMQDLQLQAAVLRAQQGRQAYEKLVEAQDALAAARAASVDLRADAERVRIAYENRLRRAKANAGRTDASAPSGCPQLLLRCTDLLARGGSLAQDFAAKHDATVDLLR